MDLIIKGATVFFGDKSGSRIADVAIEGSKIASIAENIEGDFKKVIDGSGKYLLPGVIDSQVHFREPGLEHKEDIETGSKAAAMGGVTTFLEMPNTKPSTTDPGRMEHKLNLGREKSVVNFGFFAGATKDNLDRIKKCLELQGCIGVKIFLGSSTGDLLLYDESKLLEIFSSVKSVIAVHSENEVRLNERVDIRDKATSAEAHPIWRDEETALSSTKMVINLARQAGRKVHILHITSKQEMEFLKDNKEFCTVEVTPHHLHLYAPDCYREYGTYAQVNPPIRSKDHCEALWNGITNRTVDVIGSDHAPHTREEKDKKYPASPAGMPGVQTMLPLMLDAVNKGTIEMERLVELLCVEPAKLYSMEKRGAIKEGYWADLTLVDMNRKHTIAEEEQQTKCGWTPFAGRVIKGMPVATIVRGQVVMENLELTGVRAGEAIEQL